MRIAIDYSAAVNQRAGIGRLVRNQVLALAEVDHDNDYRLVYARPNRGSVPQFPPARNFVRREFGLGERWLTILWHRAKLPVPADWLSGPVDLYHCPDFVLPPLRRARGILTVHDLAFLMRPDCADSRLRAYLEEVVPRSVRRADFIIADSENTRNDLVVLLGVRPSSVAVVPGGVEERFTRVTDEDQLQNARRKLGVGDEPFILAIGVIEPRKNLNRLMDAFAMLKERGNVPSNLKLVLAGGKGWLYDDIFDHHADSPVRDDILLPGFVSDTLLPAIYSAAEALAFPSLYEGFGLPILEAMACGTPVVASRASCLPEVADGAALMIDPNNVEGLTGALELVLLDADLRARLIAQGLERAAQYTWTKAAEQLLGVYRAVAAT
ncbi:MAG: glycosyltransferase family 4 protein [Chloroflexi bacterium]|nr:glycosyltransferase family 4 protein [Chloroflexota bacterium]MBV9596162.1 glycosyltransferase family 4 protein [Chloroflexota bacterium]